jgi:hypothetical protein
MSDLVRRLSEGEHPVAVSLRPETTVEAFKRSIDRGYVHIRFPAGHGGTELGVRLDRDRTDLGIADFAGQTGSVRIVGTLILDYVRVRCIADIDLASLRGQGHLEMDQQ